MRGISRLKKFASSLREGRRPPEEEEQIARDAGELWSASQTDATVKDWSHWKGEGRWAEEDSWYGIGRRHYAMYKQLLALAGRERSGKSLVEWGPGGGSNAIAYLKNGFETCFGVDISPANLEECARQLEAHDQTGFQPILIDPEEPEECRMQLPRKVDFFLSTAVYQHFPSKDYGLRITRLAHKLLADDGLALIQTRYDDLSGRYRPKNRDYRKNVITFTSYAIEEFWAEAEKASFSPLGLVLNPEVNYAYYYLKK
jgi:hypothetical protein